MTTHFRRKLVLLALLSFAVPATASADLARDARSIVFKVYGAADSLPLEYKAELSGSARFSVEWRRTVGQEAADLAVDADSTFSYISDGVRLAVLPSGVPADAGSLVSSVRPAADSGLSVEFNRLQSREPGNEWTYEIQGEPSLRSDTLQADSSGNWYIQGSKGSWYSVDAGGKERFSLQFGDEPSRSVPACVVAPSGDSACLSADWGLIGIREKSDSPRLFLDGRELFLARKPVVAQGTTLVPMRGVLEKLGAKVQWDSASQTVTVAKGSVKLKLKLGSKQAVVGTRSVTLASPARVYDGSVYVPLRVVSEAVGSDIAWEGPTRTIQIVARTDNGG